jgi:hypothetical protein
VDDDLKPRRSQAEERAEIDERILKSQAGEEATFLREMIRPPGQSLQLQFEREEMEKEGELRESDSAETAEEHAESERILRAEAEMEIDIPVRRDRELMKTFPGEIFIKRQWPTSRLSPTNKSPYSSPTP